MLTRYLKRGKLVTEVAFYHFVVTEKEVMRMNIMLPQNTSYICDGY
jgi:hypothetical protein